MHGFAEHDIVGVGIDAELLVVPPFSRRYTKISFGVTSRVHLHVSLGRNSDPSRGLSGARPRLFSAPIVVRRWLQVESEAVRELFRIDTPSVRRHRSATIDR